jgi:hypothetical protein
MHPSQMMDSELNSLLTLIEDHGLWEYLPLKKDEALAEQSKRQEFIQSSQKGE